MVMLLLTPFVEPSNICKSSQSMQPVSLQLWTTTCLRDSMMSCLLRRQTGGRVQLQFQFHNIESD